MSLYDSLSLARSNLSAVQGIHRDLTATLRLMNTNVHGQMRREIEDVMRAYRPIETDGGAARMILEATRYARPIEIGDAVARGFEQHAMLTETLPGTLSEARHQLSELQPWLTSAVVAQQATLAGYFADFRGHSAQDLAKLLPYANKARDLLEQVPSAVQEALSRFEELSWRPQGFLRDSSLSSVLELGSVFSEATRSGQFDLDEGDWTVTSDGEVLFEGKTVDADAIRRTLSEIGISTAEDGSGLDAETARTILREASRPENRNKPVYQLVLGWLLRNFWLFFFAVSSNLIANKIQDRIPSNREVRQQASWRIQQVTSDPDYLKELRIVLRPELLAFREIGQKSGRVATLYLGQTVRFLEKRRNWTKVEWLSDDEEGFQSGWVFSRYLEKVVLEPGSSSKRYVPQELFCD